jgi:hypothetical protein
MLGEYSQKDSRGGGGGVEFIKFRGSAFLSAVRLACATDGLSGCSGFACAHFPYFQR